EACALEMAAKVRDRLGANIGISFTGVAGLESIEGQPSGTVYIAICTDEEQKVEKFSFQGDRYSNRNIATLKGFDLLFNYMKKCFSHKTIAENRLFRNCFILKIKFSGKK